MNRLFPCINLLPLLLLSISIAGCSSSSSGGNRIDPSTIRLPSFLGSVEKDIAQDIAEETIAAEPAKPKVDEKSPNDLAATSTPFPTFTPTYPASTQVVPELNATPDIRSGTTPSGNRISNSTRRPTADPQEIGQAMATIVVRSLALRRLPLDGAPVIGGVREGESYPVSGLSRDGKWVRLNTPVDRGGRGWVRAHTISVWGEITGIEITDGLEPENRIDALAKNQAVVNTGTQRLRLRSRPDVSAETLFFAFNGELFTILERTSDNQWIHLHSAPLGAEGWALTRFLRLPEDPVPTRKPSPTSTPTVLLTPLFGPTATALPPRVPSSPTSVATPLASNESKLVSSSTLTPDLVRTQIPTSTAIVNSQATNLPSVAPGTILVATDGSRLRVRSQPTTDSEIIAYALNGERYALLETSLDSEWVRIEIKNVEGGGWISSQFVVRTSEDEE